MPAHPASALTLRDGDREVLARWSRSTSVRAGLAQRSRIVLLAADGVANTEIAERVGVSRPTVIAWRCRYDARGLVGLDDLERSGRPRTIDHDKIVAATLRPPPKSLGVTHWSSRLLGAKLRIDHTTVAKAWRAYGVQPWRSETFKFSTDPELVAKVTDVVGLYLAPPENAVVLCVDEKSQIQALDRTAPMLPMQPGLPERRTHDYKRNGTTTLFAALDIATGKVTGTCLPRHRHQEFHRFLRQVARAYPDGELHLVMDNYAAHKRIEIRDWLAANPRIHVHFTPDVGLLAQPGRGLVRDHRTPSYPPRHVHLCPRPNRQDPVLHRRLERPRPPLHLDQDRRRDPHESQPSEDFKHGPLVIPRRGVGSVMAFLVGRGW